MKTLAQIVKERAEALEGKWVALVTCESMRTAATEFERIDPEPLTGFLVLSDSKCTTRVFYEDEDEDGGLVTTIYLIFSDVPFMVKWYHHSGAPTNLKLIKSQQVSKGELGRFPNVPMPHFTRGAKGWRWVRLTDLARFLDVPPEKLWDDYYEIGRDAIHDASMEVCIDGCGKDRQVVRVNGAREPFPYGEEQYDLSRLWVPAGWASDVCYFVHFRGLNERRIARLRQERGAVAP